MSRTTLTRRVKDGEIIRISGAKGLYALPGRQVDAEEDVIHIALRAPQAVICLLTAMRLHGLEAPPSSVVWLALSSKARPPVMATPRIQPVYMSAKTLAFGVMVKTFGGVNVKVTTPAKTVADGFKYRSQIGMRTAARALRSCLDLGKASPAEIDAAAEAVRVTDLVGPLLEALS